MNNETKKPTLLDGIEISDPAALEDLMPQELTASRTFTLDGKEVTAHGSNK